MMMKMMRMRNELAGRGGRGFGLVLAAGLAVLAAAPSVTIAREPEKTAAAPAQPAVAPERAAIESTMAEMRAAVLAGDRAAYLRHIVPAKGPPGDSIFRKEQENWAKDLKDHVPAEFDLEIQDSDESPAKFWPTRAEFKMKMKWQMQPEDKRAGGKRVRSVTVPVVFTKSEEGDAGGPAGGAWLFAGENWIVIEGEPGAAIRVKFAAGYERAARDVVEVFPEVRAHVEEGFEQKVGHVQEVKIYGSMRHLQESIYLSYIDSLGGWNEPGESIKILGETAGSKASLRQVLAHEFGHVATFEYGPKANDMAWWILEGVAELSSEKFSGSQWKRTDKMVRGWAASDSLEEWKDLSDFRTVPPSKHLYVYRQGEHMIVYVTERFGRAGRIAWLRAMSNGATLDDATKDTLHLTFAELDRDWRKSLTEAKDEEAPPKGAPAQENDGEKPKAPKPSPVP